MTRALVCGGRKFKSPMLLDRVLSKLHAKRHFSLVIHGAASGADTLAGLWAKANGIPVLSFPADWTRYSNRAGPLRNQQMIDEGKPDLVVAFRGNVGTSDMIRRAKRARIEIIQPQEEMLVSVDAPHFCAALILENDIVIDAAPILKWTIGKNRDWLREYFAQHHWTAEVVNHKLLLLTPNNGEPKTG